MMRLARATAIGLLAACIHAGCGAPSAKTVKGSSAGPGTPQPAPNVEAFVHEALVGLGRADRAAHDTLARPFTVGPALWAILIQVDHKGGRTVVESLGTPSVAVVPTGGQPTEWKMRTFLSANDVAALAATISFRDLCTAFGDGAPRAANQEERALFYKLVPLEIAGKPLTVVDVQQHRLVAYVDNGRLAWMDLLSEYSETSQ
jgi:hypothetical protein